MATNSINRVRQIAVQIEPNTAK